MALKICYMSSHEILERDELLLFGELGHKYLSLGAFYSPYDQQGTLKRPSLPAEYSLFDKLKGNYDRFSLTEEQVRAFDVFIIMHHPEENGMVLPWLVKNWPLFKSLNKKVAYRSIGQSSRMVEKILKPLRDEGLLVIRYSPREETIPCYCGSDAMIRFYKDENEFKDWNGETKEVITIAQSMKQRGSACNFEAFVEVTNPFTRRLYGPHNEGSGIKGGELSYEDLKKVLRDARVYFCTNTQPASYTLNFMEALTTGTPVVALGPRHCNSDYPEQQTYEIHEIVQNGVNGFCSDNIEELQGYIKELLENDELAKKISIAGRETAIRYFGKQKAKNDWKNFFEDITK